MAPILEINNLFKNYGSTEILKDINVAIEHGDFLVLVGPSGCGKSTLLNCIAGLEPITSGKMAIDGQDMTKVSPKDRDIAMVFQSYALYPTMTVAKNITFGMKVRGIDQATQDEKLAYVAQQLQIEPLLKRKPGQLSGGQRQRVAMDVHWCGIRNCFCLTNHFPILMQSYALKCVPRSRLCINVSVHRWFM